MANNDIGTRRQNGDNRKDALKLLAKMKERERQCTSVAEVTMDGMRTTIREVHKPKH